MTNRPAELPKLPHTADFGTELPKLPPIIVFWFKLHYCLILAEMEVEAARKLIYKYNKFNIDGRQNLGLTFEPFVRFLNFKKLK